MRFTTQWQAAFRVKSFKAVVVRREWLRRGGGGGGGRGGGRRLEVTGRRAMSQRCWYLGVGGRGRFCLGRAVFWCGPERPKVGRVCKPGYRS